MAYLPPTEEAKWAETHSQQAACRVRGLELIIKTTPPVEMPENLITAGKLCVIIMFVFNFMSPRWK